MSSTSRVWDAIPFIKAAALGLVATPEGMIVEDPNLDSSTSAEEIIRAGSSNPPGMTAENQSKMHLLAA